jgi:galactose oxidase-like protein
MLSALRRRRLVLVLGCCGVVSLGTAPAFGQSDPAQFGELSPLIPFHKDAIHATLIPRGDSLDLCFMMRPAEYQGHDLVDPAMGDMGQLNPVFESLVYGGFRFSRGDFGLDESNMTRMKDDIGRENVQCVDLDNPSALSDSGKFNVAELTPDDFARNASAFSDAGASRGLNYNLFCAGNSMLADGRLLIAGGHDKGGNNGIRKINIFDPRRWRWAWRPEPAVKRDFETDPTGLMFPHANPLDELNTDPPHRSDMRYQRWYPTTVALPDGRVLILSGTDQDTSAGPDGSDATKVRQAVPEVYDPRTDRTVALENARKLFAMYPRSYVVQTGPGKRDWKVAVTAEVEPPLPTGEELEGFDPWTYSGRTYLLDVQGALRDPQRNVPAENHWTLVDSALYAHDDGAGAALWKLDHKGRARSQRVVLFGGGSGVGGVVSAVESIDYQSDAPQWDHIADLVQPASQNNAVALPDGNVVVVGGSANRGRNNSLRLQLFDSTTNTLMPGIASTVPRHDHSTTLVLPDASVIIMGGNRTNLVPGNRNAGVPVAEIFRPPYLFKGARPRIYRAPDDIDYGEEFDVHVRGSEIRSAALIRIGPVTHNWDWDNRYVQLDVDDDAHRWKRTRTVEIEAPARPALAVPGYYMLFMVDEEGVPSVARTVHIDVDR